MRRIESGRTAALLTLTIILSVIIAISSMAAVAAADSSHPAKVVIATSAGSAPFHFNDNTGQPVGMFVDLWRLWSQKTGIEAEFKSASWNGTLEMVRDGRADIHAGLFYSGARDAFLDYAAPLHKSDTNFFYHKTIFEVHDPDDLLPFNIGIVKGDLAVDYIKKRLPDAAIAIFPSNEALFDAAKAGNIRVFIKDTPIALYHLARRKMVDQFRYYASRPLYDNMFYAAVKRGNHKLLALINTGMQSITEPERARIVRKWMGVSDKKTEGVLVIAIANGYMPFTGLNFAGEPTGMFVDVWRLWSRKTGKAIEFSVSDRSDTLYASDRGIADVHSGVTSTSDRRDRFDFAKPFYTVTSNLFFPVAQGVPIAPEKLAGMKVGALLASFQARFLHTEFPDIELVTFHDTQAMIQAALNGTVRAYLDETPVSLAYLERLGESGKFRYDSVPLFSQAIHPAFKKSMPDIAAMIKTGFDAITDKELAAIEKRWITTPEIRQIDAGQSEIRLTVAEREFIANHRTIRLGIDPAWPPFDYIGDDGKTHKGMASDYVHLLNQRLGLDMEAVPGLTWSQVLDGVKSHTVDVIACLPATPQRREFLKFTRPYLSFPWVIITRDDYPFVGDLRDLYGKTTAMVKGYTIHEHVTKDHFEIKPLLIPSPLKGLHAVSTGRADAYIDNLAVISYLIEKHHIANLKVAAPADIGPGGDRLRFGVRKDWPELAAILNKGLASITQEKQTEIRRKWFSAVRYEKWLDSTYIRKWLLRIGVLVFLIMSVILFRNRMLKREVRFRVQAEEKIKNSEQRLSQIINFLPAPTWVIDHQGKVLAWNRAIEKLTGTKSENMVGKGDYEYAIPIYGERRPCLIDLVRHWDETYKDAYLLLDQEGNTLVSETWHPDLGENGICFRTTASILYDTAGQEMGAIETLHDITQLKQTEKNLIKARKDADSANQAKSIFLANMSHEIRTPMNAILGFSQIMLRDPELTTDQKQNLDTIWRSGEHLLALINDILEVSKIEAGRITLNPTVFDLHTLLDDLKMMFQMRSHELNISFSITKSDDTPRYIETDEGKLRQVLINLLGNAVKFTVQGGVTLTVECKKQEADPQEPESDALFLIPICFQVKDTGVGIDVDELEKVFRPFEQSSSGRQTEGGTGLGLAIGRDYARLMGGDITVVSRVNQGSTFTFDIRAVQGDAGQARALKSERHVIRLESGQPAYRVLVADDRKTNRQVLLKMLDAVGFEVREVENGKEAVQVFEEWRPHLILTDMVMPVMDGFEAIRKIKAMPYGRETVIFGVTASVLADERDAVLAAGAAEFIRKPFREHELFDAILSKAIIGDFIRPFFY